MDEQIEDKSKCILIPNESVSIFKLGDKISKYLDLDYELFSKSESESSFDTYDFIDIPVSIWLDEETNSRIKSIQCEVSCIWKGKELIGMLYDDFLENYHLTADGYNQEYIAGPGVNERNYDIYNFNRQGLLLLVWRKKIRSILVFKNSSFFRVKRKKHKGKQIENKHKCILIPNESVSIFKFGNQISEYLSQNHDVTPKSESKSNFDTYDFIDIPVSVWLDEETNSIIDTIHCNDSCIWNGKELIGMLYTDFLNIYQLQADSSKKLNTVGPCINRRNYDIYCFYEQGLIVWVCRKRIRQILVSKYEEDEPI